VHTQVDLLGIEKAAAKIDQWSPEISSSLQYRGSFILCQKEGVEVFFFPHLRGQHLSAGCGDNILFFALVLLSGAHL
jgi:hypothetical protein